MAAMLCYPPSPGDRRTPRMAFRVQYDSDDTDTLIEVPSELRAFLAPQPVTLIWGGLPARIALNLNSDSQRTLALPAQPSIGSVP
ncbi:hypothetical protein [Saccharopolyspora shandongensis]|uniref:hypothetical protein n=1 Tax=Saccharopolyspora shandongensis TaxID=418495 RepID=UPI0033D9632A